MFTAFFVLSVSTNLSIFPYKKVSHSVSHFLNLCYSLKQVQNSDLQHVQKLNILISLGCKAKFV